MSKKTSQVQRFLQWLFGSPFQERSDVIGDPVPPELRAFEAHSDEMAHHLNGKVASPRIHSSHRKSS
jgi:hypothetical protein